MSDPTYNGKTYRKQGGDTFIVDSGGSIQVLSGGVLAVAPGGVISAPSGFTIGGTFGRWAFGTVGFASGVGTFATGLTRVVSAQIQPVSADPPGLGSFTTSVIDLSLSGAGSVIFRAGVGSLPYAAGGTCAWQAFGT